MVERPYPSQSTSNKIPLMFPRPIFCDGFWGLVEGQSARLEHWLVSFVDGSVARIEEMVVVEGGEWFTGMAVTVGDCALFATVQCAERLWGLNLFGEYPRWRLFYEGFGKRDGAVVLEGTWLKEMMDVMRKFNEF